MRPDVKSALDQLLPRVYDDLRHVAAAAMRGERRDHTLQTTALVHEAYLKLRRISGLDVDDRPQLYALAARAMRQVLVDHARARRAAKRGGAAVRVTLCDQALAAEPPICDLLALDRALEQLETIDPRQVRVIELRFVAGLSVREVAAALEISPTTVKREAAMARAWLYRELAQQPAAVADDDAS